MRYVQVLGDFPARLHISQSWQSSSTNHGLATELTQKRLQARITPLFTSDLALCIDSESHQNSKMQSVQLTDHMSQKEHYTHMKGWGHTTKNSIKREQGRHWPFLPVCLPRVLRDVVKNRCLLPGGITKWWDEAKQRMWTRHLPQSHEVAVEG